MRRDDKFRFSLGWSRDTAEKIAVGDLLERLKNRKSDLVVQAVWEYIGNHPEVMTEDAKIVISVHSTPTDEQTFAKIQSMIDASLEKLKTTLKLQLEQGQPEDASGPSEKDLDDMLKKSGYIQSVRTVPTPYLEWGGDCFEAGTIGAAWVR